MYPVRLQLAVTEHIIYIYIERERERTYNKSPSMFWFENFYKYSFTMYIAA